MRKISFYILAVIFLIVTTSGCSDNGANTTAQIPAKFESDFNADYGRLKLSGHISKLETGIYDITITAPESIENIKFSYVGGKITTSLGGISFDTNSESQPVSGFITEVASLIDTISKPNLVDVTKAEGYNRYCTLSQAENACILQEQDSGSIVSLTVKSADISMNFVEFQIK